MKVECCVQQGSSEGLSAAFKRHNSRCIKQELVAHEDIQQPYLQLMDALFFGYPAAARIN